MNEGGNNFNLISEAERLLKDVDTESLFTEENDEKVFDVLNNSGILTVSIIPDFHAARSKILLDPYEIKRDDGTVYRKEVRKLHRKGRHTPHSVYTNIIKKMIENRSRGVGINLHPRDKWRIDIGFLHPDSPHTNPEGCTVSTGRLVAMLVILGYDPLLRIRRKSFLSNARKEMAEVIVGAINNSRSGHRLNIRQKLERLAKKISDDAKDYVHGGEKPALSKKTIENRRYKQNRENKPVSYEGARGIYEPLSETQQLEAEISYRVVGESSWEDDLVKAKDKVKKIIEHEAKVGSEAVWKKHVEREKKSRTVLRKASKSVIEKIKKSSRMSKFTDEMERYSEELDIEEQSRKSIMRVESEMQSIEYFGSQKKSREAHASTVTYQQQLRLVNQAIVDKYKGKLTELVMKYGVAKAWPAAILKKYRPMVEAYNTASGILAQIDRADFGENHEQGHGF